jgi:hypothetical protein
MLGWLNIGPTSQLTSQRWVLRSDCRSLRRRRRRRSTLLSSYSGCRSFGLLGSWRLNCRLILCSGYRSFGLLSSWVLCRGFLCSSRSSLLGCLWRRSRSLCSGCGSLRLSSWRWVLCSRCRGLCRRSSLWSSWRWIQCNYCSNLRQRSSLWSS